MVRLSDLRRRTERAVHRLLAPIAPDTLRTALDRLTEGGTETMFVHASLNNCGRFTAGPDDVLEALGSVCDTLGFPTHTYSYPSAVGELGPVFNPKTTPSQTGMLTELFRTKSQSLRSIQSTHSLAMSGPHAAELTTDHYKTDTPCGAGTPYSRLVERRTSVLMFGVTFHSYTLFHTAEDASGSSYAYEDGTIDRLRVVDENGKTVDCLSRRQTRNARRFKEAGELMERAGLARRLRLGRGDLLYMRDCSLAHDFLVERLRKIPDFLYESCAKELQ